MKYESFFGVDGITCTSAGHLCNIAREYIQSAKIELTNLSFIETSIKPLDSNSKPVITKIATGNLDHINDLINKIIKSNTFIAYMQEAIKAKKAKYDIIKLMSFDRYCELNNINPALPPKERIKRKFEDFFNEMSIKDKARYYSLEAEVATIGKLIHPEGSIHDARNEMLEANSKPAHVEDNIVYFKTIMIDPNRVEELYFNLQRKHRSLEAELNAIKNSIETKVKEYNDSIDLAYAKEYEQYTKTHDSEIGKFTVWVNAELKRINELKIAIPSSLMESYTFLSSL